MTPLGLARLAVFIFTAFISIVTGGTSLITVPAMMGLGIEPHVAVATNRLTLIFLSLGGTVPLLKSGPTLPCRRLPSLVGLMLIGSILGALLLLAVPAKAMPYVVVMAMLAVVVFSHDKGQCQGVRVAGASALR